MDEKRVKQLINQIERIRDEVEATGVKWHTENEDAGRDVCHASCVDAMGLAARDLGRAKNHLDAIVS